jgi:hypothetical protein
MLGVEYEKEENSYKNIHLIGPAIKVFEGQIELPATLNFS